MKISFALISMGLAGGVRYVFEVANGLKDKPQVRPGEGGEEEGLRQVQVLEEVQGFPPGEMGSARAGVGHGEVARAVQGRGEGEDEGGGGVAQGGGAGAQIPPPALLRVKREVERQALDPGAGGTSSTWSWTGST